ncbi:UDP-N-acetylmuramate dehydrogenase [Prodigiosinella aquatilis]|nr:UDP-N-acetylmuramate dehydrogenase [Prodigiosinella sp. LS101]WJV55958.1 UDP-N-acetylmuramate dehydrogenase [Prodigiosinella sp. LS101]WJV60322.1 UDP-N-acetylmuramate dehydrogenase [Pectobacteriaceae bacterium C111]
MMNSATSLKQLNSFSLPVCAADVVVAKTREQLIFAWNRAKTLQQPALILGEGSNVLFLEDFSGSVILNRIKHIEIEEKDIAWDLHIGAGENWHHLVEYTLNRNIAGLENLALIPGCVGSAPIQNIGAYGVELKKFCSYVDLLDLNSGITNRLTANECQFGYRESIFKHQYRNGFAITAVGLSLKKAWEPVLEYGTLTGLDTQTITPKQIFDAVCNMRRSKLPDPAIIGNAGSFFKNPVISGQQAIELLKKYPLAPHYPQSGGDVKIAAGWLIDQCHLKGFQIGGAAVHNQQALVLINRNEATSQDIIKLAHHVLLQVAEKFDIWLEPEVRFIAHDGEVNAMEVLS